MARFKPLRRLALTVLALPLVVLHPLTAVPVAVLRTWRTEATRRLVVLAALALTAGTIFYRLVESFSWLDSLYFSFITLTTIGYGDYVPATAAGKIFTIFYVLAGLGIIFGFVDAITSQRLSRGILGGRFRSARPGTLEGD